MKIKRFGVAAIALAAAGALTLSGCTSGGASPSAGAGDSTAVITTNGTEPQNPLVPTNTNEVGGGKILDAIFAGLVYYDAEGAPHNDMAESIETDDAQNYTIKLKADQKFTNGEPVTANSFVDAWNYGALLSNEQLSSYFFESIEGFSYDEDSELTGLEVVDDLTFTVKLKQPESDFPLRLGYSAFFPLPESAFEDIAAFGENPIGNGPYMLDGEGAWKHNEKIDLVVNPDYAGDRKAQNGGLDIIFYATQEAAYADLQGGNLDVLDAIPDGALSTFEDEFGDRAVNQAAAIFQSFTIPARLPHFGGEEGKLRRAAISKAINREEITDVIFSGTRTPAHDFTSPGHRRLLRGHPRLRGPRLRRRRGEEAVGRGRRHLPVGRHLPDRVQRRRRPPGLGRRCREPAEEQPRHRRVGRSVPDLRRGRAPRSPTAPSRPRSAPVGRPTTRPCSTSSDRSTRRAPARTTATTRAPSSTRCSRRASPRPTSPSRTRSSRPRRRSSSRTSPRSRCGTPRSTAHGARRSTTSQFGWNSVPLYYEVTKSE